MAKMSPMRMRLANGLPSPPGGGARARSRDGSGMASLARGRSWRAASWIDSFLWPLGSLAGRRLASGSPGRGREGAERLLPVRLESTQTQTLPHLGQGVKVEGQVV